jgi:GDP-L-fucose synthase
MGPRITVSSRPTVETNYPDTCSSGQPLGELSRVDDLAAACVLLMENYNSGALVNIGDGTDTSIRDLTFLIKEVVDFRGEIRFNPEKPDCVQRKLLDVSKIKSLGWAPLIYLHQGLESTYEWYLANEDRIRK